MKKIMLLSMTLCCGLFGCGTPGPSSELTTVYLTATPSSSRLEADVLTGNSCSAGGGKYQTETIPIVVTSTAYANATDKYPVTINSIKISYSKADPTSAAPSLPIHYDSGLMINPGESKTFDVTVAPDNLKADMVNNYGFNLCSLDYWQYYATITISGFENYSNREVSIVTSVTVAFADRNNI